MIDITKINTKEIIEYEKNLSLDDISPIQIDVRNAAYSNINCYLELTLPLDIRRFHEFNVEKKDSYVEEIKKMK